MSLLLVLLLGIGCSKQAEGERCDRNNGNLDCEANLACVGEESLSITGNGVALCCPVLTEPTVDACRASRTFEPEADAVTTPLPTPVPDAGNTPVAPDGGLGNDALPTVDAGT